MNMERAIKIVQGVGEFFDIISEQRRYEILSGLEKKPETVQMAICMSQSLTPGKNQSYGEWMSPTDIEVVRGRRSLHWASNETLLHILRFTKLAERYK